LLKDDARAPSGITTSLLLDPERDFVVMNLARQGTGDDISRVTFEEYEESNGAWVPKRWNNTFFGVGGVVSTANVSLVSDFELNVPIEPQEFKLEFPRGTWVTEEENSAGYIVKDGGKRRQITGDELVSGATYEDFANSETGGLAALKEGERRQRFWLLLAVPTTLGAAIVYFLIRRTKSKRLLSR
jgi:hypothetical protein